MKHKETVDLRIDKHGTANRRLCRSVSVCVGLCRFGVELPKIASFQARDHLKISEMILVCVCVGLCRSVSVYLVMVRLCRFISSYLVKC